MDEVVDAPHSVSQRLKQWRADNHSAPINSTAKSKIASNRPPSGIRSVINSSGSKDVIQNTTKPVVGTKEGTDEGISMHSYN